MSNLGVSIAADCTYAVLDYYLKGPAFAQTIQDKPLLRLLQKKKRSFPGGKGNIATNVQGTFMSETAGFLAGFSGDDSVSFTAAANILQVQYSWKEMHAGLWITETELKRSGITIVDGQQAREHSEAAKVVITNLLSNRLEDYGESWSRAWQSTFWRDGTQDAKGIPGITSLLTDTPTTGSTGGLDRATNTWWRHRYNVQVQYSEQDQTLSKFLRAELRQLRRYGGRPDNAFCGSDFLAALEAEYQAKGQYTTTGFEKTTNELGMAKMTLAGLGTFEYDPTLDDLGYSKRCVVLDSNRIYYAPMEGEDDKRRQPERPYNYFVFLQSMTKTGGLVCTQLNCNGVYGIQ